MRLQRGSTVVEAIVGALMDGILDGKLAPGARIPAERELATTLEVSRVSVRSAVGRLISWGVVETRQGSGATVRSRDRWTIDALAAVLEHGLRRGAYDRILPLVRDAFELRRTLVLDFVERAATRFDGESGALDETRMHMRRADEVRDDTPAFREHDDRVMASMLAAAQMEGSLWLVNSLFAPYRAAIDAAMDQMPVPESYLRRNLAVADAVEAGDAKTARREQAAFLDELDAAFMATLPRVLSERLEAKKEE